MVPKLVQVVQGVVVAEMEVALSSKQVNVVSAMITQLSCVILAIVELMDFVCC